MFFSPSITAESKSKGVINYIIANQSVPLPELMQLKINWEKLASVSTHISDWRAYARKLGYNIINIHTLKDRKYQSTYIAQAI